ncbi:MAG: hypothetical protein LBS54_01490 [Dysgonamonadaceae bacterium]|jgi:hypothetical protein|nr:hypothetical protein [Dysgonamonadaceae bacterium]
MAAKKKKTNVYVQQKIQAAKHQKIFMERLRNLCTTIGNGEQLFDLLPYYVTNTIYVNRGAAIKIRVEPGAKITKRFVKIMYAHIDQETKKKKINILLPGRDIEVSLSEYNQYILPLETVLLNVPEFHGKEKFDDFVKCWEDRYRSYIQGLIGIVNNTCYAYSDIGRKKFYTFQYNEHRAYNGCGKNEHTGMLYQVITLGIYKLDIKHVTINGDSRPAVQTGEIQHSYNQSTLLPTTVLARRLGLKTLGSKEIPVYVQQHAVERTMQRACCVYPGCVHSMINKAFINKHQIIREGERYLIECYDNDIKIGYFVGIYVEEILVIRTFLLITHSGTPEGRKLSELTGLQRSDISFLAIDDLKTLINSDIVHDSRVLQIFLEAGCESILDMNFMLHRGDFAWLKDEAKQNIKLAEMITEYIQLGDSDEEYFENDK